LSAAAATSAAYLAITPGKGGKAARIIGNSVWTSANKAAELYQQFEINRRLVNMIGMVKSQDQKMKEVGNLEDEITALLSDVEDTVGRAESLENEELTIEKAKTEVSRLEKARGDELEAERALQEEEASIAKEEARLAEEQLAEIEAARLAEEKARKDELDVERARQEDMTRMAEEEARLAEEQLAEIEAARLAEEKARKDELDVERARQEDMTRMEEEEALLAEEEARFTEEQLAKEMDIAALARKAVELFEAAGLGDNGSEEINGSDWEDLHFDEPTDQDLEEVSTSADFTEDFDQEFDLDTVARMAREAVNQFESKLETEEIAVGRDWSLLTVVDLKKELKKRELKATGRKADLVVALERYDQGLANKEETLTQHLDSQTEVNVSLEIDSSNNDDPSFDIKIMTVSQLKEELRKRGLKVGGKKADLIDRLASA